MEEKKLYRDYFDIDSKSFPVVTADLIKSGQVSWKSFYPHETFVKLLESTHATLSGKSPGSLWVEGAYGTGKSYAAYTVKSMLEASDDEIREYFADYGLKNDLCQQLITDKNSGRLITVHRIGSASIRSDQDLILAVQDSITAALREHNIENRGESALRQAAIDWLEEKEANRIYFDSLIQEDKYMWDFGGRHVKDVLEVLKNNDDTDAATRMVRNILNVANDNGITALRLDVQALCEWIKSILENNDISAILFVWDEFTEFFLNNPNSLTGFQTLVEISMSHPFYFLLVTHEGSSMIKDRDTRRKIMDRFVGHSTIRIEIPENIAFQLMAQALKETSDPMLKREWIEYKGDLNNELTGVRSTIISDAKKTATMGDKTILNDAELQAITPIHPYAALLLKHMAVAFQSSARSMFEFIGCTDDTKGEKAFKWYIGTHGPLDDMDNLLTVDMLWDYFTGVNHNGLYDDVRVILDSYNLLKKGSLTPDQERVFKTVLLLEAISTRVSNVDILRPNAQNIDLAFLGTDWSKGKASSIAEGLSQQGYLFKKPVGNGMTEYTVANSGGDGAKIEKLKKDIRAALKTQDLIVSANLLESVKLPDRIKGRFLLEPAAAGNFGSILTKAKNAAKPNRFTIVVTFALNDDEAGSVKDAVTKNVVLPTNTFYYAESLVPLGEDQITQYVDNMAYSRYYTQNDRIRANGFENQAKQVLDDWKLRISSGAFMLYTPDNKSGMRLANLSALQEELEKLNHQIYHCGLEQFNLIGSMYSNNPLAQGAECGIKEELSGTFKSPNASTSLATALNGAWKVARYWEDPTKKSLPIVRIKQKAEEIVQNGLSQASGRISMYSIFEAFEDAPFGFMPNNIAAFVMGFVLKEYATSDYFWSNGSTSETMTPDKMKQMIANAIKHKINPLEKFKEEYIVAMSPSQRNYLQCTSKAFGIPMAQCGSIENSRDQIRIKMKGLTFPIWCLKYLLAKTELTTPRDKISEVIDAYCGIANTANGNKTTESDLADQIGKTVDENPTIVQDLEKLLTNEMCRKGMLAYIEQYRGGELNKLAGAIGDNGAYLNEVKQKFNADAANWVWNSETADEKISDVILEYRIIAESNKSLPKCTSLFEVVTGWNKRTNNIRMPYDSLRRYVGDLKPFLEQLYYMKQSGQLQEQNKQKFYDALLTQRESFDKFYTNQLSYFEQVASIFLENMDSRDISDFFNDIPTGQFTKSSNEYDNYLSDAVEKYKKQLKRAFLKNLWFEKTGTKDPVEWSDKYKTPILCMFGDAERVEAKNMFGIITAYASPDAETDKAITYFENATFYENLDNPVERDRCFKERIIGDYSIMLGDIEAVRNELSAGVPLKAYDWMDNSNIQNKLKTMAEKQYRLKGRERAMAVIDKMDPGELRRYLNELIADNLTVGMEILKNK